MLTDPLSVTIDGDIFALNRINQDGYSSEYLLVSSTMEYRVRVRNSSFLDKAYNVTRNRHNVELTQTIYPAGATPAKIRKAYIVFENQQGDTLDDPVNVAAGLCGLLTESTNAVLTKVINFES
jgi:hypothetical protein